MSETGYTEDCCWTFIRQYCKAPWEGQCSCRCHTDWPATEDVKAQLAAANARAARAERERDTAYMMLRSVRHHLEGWGRRGDFAANSLVKRIDAVLALAPAVAFREVATDSAEPRAGQPPQTGDV